MNTVVRGIGGFEPVKSQSSIHAANVNCEIMVMPRYDPKWCLIPWVQLCLLRVPPNVMHVCYDEHMMHFPSF